MADNLKKRGSPAAKTINMNEERGERILEEEVQVSANTCVCCVSESRRKRSRSISTTFDRTIVSKGGKHEKTCDNCCAFIFSQHRSQQCQSRLCRPTTRRLSWCEKAAGSSPEREIRALRFQGIHEKPQINDSDPRESIEKTRGCRSCTLSSTSLSPFFGFAFPPLSALARARR